MCIYIMHIQVENDTPMKRTILMYNPLITSIKVLQKAFIHEGKKRVRSAKIYYMLKKDPKTYTIK